MLLPMAPTDSMFLLGESRDHPMHVGGSHCSLRRMAAMRAMCGHCSTRHSVGAMSRRCCVNVPVGR
ncbi:acyltransferase domain protein [Rhodococcus sp. MTM3W5.2]|nr:acyltransferase domain protein [Rhodococcus sp. MTM3W5.2]